MAVSLRQLRYFEAAVRNRSISKAAFELNVSQSSVSVAIKDLELYLGVPLVERSQKGVAPTYNGSMLCGEANQICGRVDRIKRLVSEPKGQLSGKLKVSVSSSVLSLILPDYIGEFVMLNPGVNLRISNKEWPEFQDELLTGDLDMAFNAGTNDVPNTIEVQRINSFPRRLWVNSHRSILERTHITQEDLAGQRVFIYEYDYALSEFREFVDAIEEQGAIIERIHEMEAIRRLVQADVGMCILSDLSYESDKMISKNVVVVPMEPVPPPFEVSIYKLKSKTQSPASISFLGHLLSRIL
ncbi:MAG: hypothetical protein COA78_00125 [Blastopirellula sp.]|nr:MAG: hypothetical protein COA78_00125 [Blastopirellula sp.]